MTLSIDPREGTMEDFKRPPRPVAGDDNRRAGDRRTWRDRRRRNMPVAADRRWLPSDRRSAQRRDSLAARLVRYVG